MRLLILALLVALPGCTNMLGDAAAQRLAAPAFMVRHEVEAGPFLMTTYERVRGQVSGLGGGTAQVYIAGGDADWRAPERFSLDPTTGNPVALHLAAKADTADVNVAWIARPCQITMMADRSACDKRWWGADRFAPEVFAAYDIILDDLRRRHGWTRFEVIGYSGGAVIAARLAATREDVVSLRTVAGPLEQIVPLAPHLRDLPQRHFAGGQDEVAPPAGLYAYLKAVGDSPCVAHTFVPEAAHHAGWVERWPALLAEPVTCAPFGV